MKLNNEPYESHPLPEYLNQHKSDNIDALNFQVIVKLLNSGVFFSKKFRTKTFKNEQMLLEEEEKGNQQ